MSQIITSTLRTLQSLISHAAALLRECRFFRMLNRPVQAMQLVYRAKTKIPAWARAVPWSTSVRQGVVMSLTWLPRKSRILRLASEWTRPVTLHPLAEIGIANNHLVGPIALLSSYLIAKMEKVSDAVNQTPSTWSMQTVRISSASTISPLTSPISRQPKSSSFYSKKIHRSTKRRRCSCRSSTKI